MKKRIAAMLLAAVMVCNIVGGARPAKAEAVAATTVALTYLVYNLYAVMTGRWDDCAEALGCVLENGVEGFEKAFVGTDDTPSWFCTGWNQISKTVAGWFDDGTIELSEDGKVYMDYYNYLELCNIMYDYVDLSLELGSSRRHTIINTPFDKLLPVNSLPVLLSPIDGRVIYIPVYYSTDTIYMSYYYIAYLDYMDIVEFIIYKGGKLWSNSYSNTKLATSFYYSAANNTAIYSRIDCWGDLEVCTRAVDNWVRYNTTDGLTSVTYDAVDTSLSQGYLMTEGSYEDFVKTITDIVTSPDASQVDDLSDALDDLLVLNPDPGLVVDTDPTIEIPTDAILITDITGVEDMTLTDALEDVKPRLDLEIPTSIWDKFPFSLPFDFYRLLTIFVAEPKAPVFRIPISNVNVDMSAYEDNQTIAPYVNSDSELMFEIDEEIVIDLSGLPFVQAISYTCFIVGWVALLIFATSKLIHH